MKYYVWNINKFKDKLETYVDDREVREFINIYVRIIIREGRPARIPVDIINITSIDEEEGKAFFVEFWERDYKESFIIVKEEQRWDD